MRRPRELLEGVAAFHVATPTLPPATHTASYALGGRAVVLVEPASPFEDEQRAWLAWAEGIRREGRRLAAIVLTHHHPDHVGGASDAARALDLPLWAHRETAARLPELSFDRLLDEGDEISPEGWDSPALRVLHTPGHAAGHVCLHEPERGLLVVGDMIASIGTILIDPDEGDMARYLDELRRLEALGATLALPAHGEGIDEPTAAFARYVAHRLMREERVRDAVADAGPAADLDALLARAYADTPTELWPLARLSLRAHLAKLEREGGVRREGAGWSTR